MWKELLNIVLLTLGFSSLRRLESSTSAGERVRYLSFRSAGEVELRYTNEKNTKIRQFEWKNKRNS